MADELLDIAAELRSIQEEHESAENRLVTQASIWEPLVEADDDDDVPPPPPPPPRERRPGMHGDVSFEG